MCHGICQYERIKLKTFTHLVICFTDNLDKQLNINNSYLIKNKPYLH